MPPLCLSGLGTGRSSLYCARCMQVEVWSDFACPWCALGLVRLDAALGAFEHGAAVEVVHRAYELHPGASPRREGTMEEMVARKYGLHPQRVRAGHERLTVLGAAEGFTFDFPRVQLGSTFDAHRLAKAACGTPAEPSLVRALFRAHFSDGRQLSDHAVLREVARESGLPEEVAEAVLAGGACGAEVRADEARAAELDVMGVPYFLIGGAWPVPGAQDVETMLVVLHRAWSRFGQ
jgi:predicted DsbA family dithiol-disulfide isomerase